MLRGQCLVCFRLHVRMVAFPVSHETGGKADLPISLILVWRLYLTRCCGYGVSVAPRTAVRGQVHLGIVTRRYLAASVGRGHLLVVLVSDRFPALGALLLLLRTLAECSDLCHEYLLCTRQLVALLCRSVTDGVCGCKGMHKQVT